MGSAREGGDGGLVVKGDEGGLGVRKAVKETNGKWDSNQPAFEDGVCCELTQLKLGKGTVGRVSDNGGIARHGLGGPSRS